LRQDYKVTISINDETDGDKAVITIEGDDDKLVEECFNKINLIHHFYEIKSGAEQKLRQAIGDYIQRYGLVYFYYIDQNVYY
jgi:hypothetical protein